MNIKNPFGGKSKKKAIFKKTDHVHRDWFIALMVTCVVIVLLVAFDAFIFLQRQTFDPQPQTTTGDVENLIDQELLTETLEYYDSKEKTFLRHQSEVPNAPEL